MDYHPIKLVEEVTQTFLESTHGFSKNLSDRTIYN